MIPRGVDLVRFDPESVGEDRLAALRQAWSLDPQDQSPLLLLPARLTGWKGQREAIRALGRLQDDPDVETPRLVLAGDAQGRQTYVEELQALAASENVVERVFIVGHCSDMPAAMMLSDLVLTPSNEPEAFGRTAAEAGAMLKPVIAADHGGAREVVLHGETLAPEGRATVGERARAHVNAEFSTVSLQASTLRVYHEVLNSPS